jgi:hypothetical protein
MVAGLFDSQRKSQQGSRRASFVGSFAGEQDGGEQLHRQMVSYSFDCGWSLHSLVTQKRGGIWVRPTLSLFAPKG